MVTRLKPPKNYRYVGYALRCITCNYFIDEKLECERPNGPKFKMKPPYSDEDMHPADYICDGFKDYST